MSAFATYPVGSWFSKEEQRPLRQFVTTQCHLPR
jgi:hypothetical protein